MSRLVLVSNRVAVPKKGEAPGGLAIGLLAAARARGGLWIGWSGEVGSDSHAESDLIARNGTTYVTFDMTQREYKDYYLGFSNGVLWPIFHYFLDSFRFYERQYEAYQDMNLRFAREIGRLLQPEDLVWAHDFHLIPLAQKLRAAGTTNRLGFFLHIPFPQLEVLRALPVYDEMVRALLAYDLIGLQTEIDRQALRDAVRSLWGAEALHDDEHVRVGTRLVRIGVYPIGVDVDEVQREASEATASSATQRMLAGLLGRRLMIGVDRLDYSKGLVERFKAYERFLEMYPDQQGRVTFLQIAPLSRADLRAYADIRSSLESAAGRTNGRFADTDWTPIRYLNRNFPHDILMSFLRGAQVAAVTPLRDGMNLVAKEFVAAQDAEDPGVLLLSTLAGAARELSSGAIVVNPYDARGMAHAMQTALSMPLAERRERHQSMLGILRTNNIHHWCTRFTEDLASHHAS